MFSLPVELIVAIGVVFAAVALLTGYVASSVLARQTPTQRRLDAMVAPASNVVIHGSLTAGRDPLLARWSKMLPKSVKDMSRVEKRLAAAGIRSGGAAIAYAVLELTLPLVVGGLTLFLVGYNTAGGMATGILAGLVAYFVPGFFVDYKVGQRRKQIRNGLPDVLDLLIVCLEAGSSLDQAIVKASEELSLAYPALGEELRVLTTETRAGKPRLEAFKNLAQRTKVEDVRTLVAMLVQTDRFGTSVAETLRTMADEMRTKRRQAAEERAAKVGAKLVFPLVFCLFPALYVVMLGPAVITYIRTFGQ